MNKIVKLTLILFLVSALVAGVLGLTNMVTEEPIRLYKEEKTAEAYRAVMSFDSYDEVKYDGNRGEIGKVYKTNNGDWIVEANVSGSQGMILSLIHI